MSRDTLPIVVDIGSGIKLTVDTMARFPAAVMGIPQDGIPGGAIVIVFVLKGPAEALGFVAVWCVALVAIPFARRFGRRWP